MAFGKGFFHGLLATLAFLPLFIAFALALALLILTTPVVLLARLALTLLLALLSLLALVLLTRIELFLKIAERLIRQFLLFAQGFCQIVHRLFTR